MTTINWIKLNEKNQKCTVDGLDYYAEKMKGGDWSIYRVKPHFILTYPNLRTVKAEFEALMNNPAVIYPMPAIVGWELFVAVNRIEKNPEKLVSMFRHVDGTTYIIRFNVDHEAFQLWAGDNLVIETTDNILLCETAWTIAPFPLWKLTIASQHPLPAETRQTVLEGETPESGVPIPPKSQTVALPVFPDHAWDNIEFRHKEIHNTGFGAFYMDAIPGSRYGGLECWQISQPGGRVLMTSTAGESGADFRRRFADYVNSGGFATGADVNSDILFSLGGYAVAYDPARRGFNFVLRRADSGEFVDAYPTLVAAIIGVQLLCDGQQEPQTDMILQNPAIVRYLETHPDAVLLEQGSVFNPVPDDGK